MENNQSLPMVLFVCRHNAGRSQMSAAFFNREAAGKARGESAGTTPGEHVHPVVIDVMKEVGIDLTDKKPRLLTDELQTEATVAVTMGCGDACPLVLGKVIDWDLEDPKDQPIEKVRVIRDDIEQRIKSLLGEILK